MIYQLETFRVSATRSHEELIKKMNAILHRLTRIQKNQNDVLVDLHKYLKNRIDSAVQRLLTYLASEDARERFASWTEEEVPKVEGRQWEDVKTEITATLEKRLRKIIKKWEEENEVFADARKALIRRFEQGFHVVEAKLRNLQDAVTADSLVTQGSNHDHLAQESMTMAQKITIGITSPIWVPIGLFVLVVGAPFVGIKNIKEKLDDLIQIRKYENDKCGFMAEAAEDYLNATRNVDSLTLFVKEQLNQAEHCLKQIEARIPELIYADKMLYEKLKDRDLRVALSLEDINDLYGPSLASCFDIRGKLALFALKELKFIDISTEDLDLSEESWVHIGCDAFATLHQGKMKRDGHEQSVVIKVYKEVLGAKNASLIMEEVESLR